METWALIFNPEAGRFRPGRLEALVRRLREGGVTARLLPTERPGHAVALARAAEGVARVAVYGGDGTLNEAANGLLERGDPPPLAFLPGGTVNVMALELGLSLDPVRAAGELLCSVPRMVRPGLVNGRAFLLMAGIGYDARSVRRVSPVLKRRTGRFAYFWSGLRALADPAPPLRLLLPGEAPLEGVWLVAARAAHYAGKYHVHPSAGLLKDSLGLIMVRRRWVLPFLVGHLGLGLHRERRGIALREFRAGRVECERPVPVQVDGDACGEAASFSLALAERTLPLCFPLP